MPRPCFAGWLTPFRRGRPASIRAIRLLRVLQPVSSGSLLAVVVFPTPHEQVCLESAQRLLFPNPIQTIQHHVQPALPSIPKTWLLPVYYPRAIHGSMFRYSYRFSSLHFLSSYYIGINPTFLSGEFIQA